MPRLLCSSAIPCISRSLVLSKLQRATLAHDVRWVARVAAACSKQASKHGEHGPRRGAERDDETPAAATLMGGTAAPA